MTTHSCQSCHRRKVRCDANASGPPCTNCRLDRRRCEKRAPLKRGRKSRLVRNGPRTAEPSISNHIRGNTVVSIPESLDETPSATSSSFPRIAQEKDDIPADAHIFVPFYYHSYLQPPDISHLRPAQIQILEDQGCLKVPSGFVLHEFIRHYFLYVHPCLPILDEASFWSVYSGHCRDTSAPRGISFTLFQAMLFAASRFVQPQIIESCGLKSLKHTRTLFHQRAELLLLNEVERDPLTLAQTSLLLSLQSTIDDQSLNSKWLKRAIHYAKQAGAHEYYKTDPTTARSLREKKKLWWCCILRDRMIAIGVRRNIQITPSVFDFDQQNLEESDFAGDQAKSQVYQPATQKILTRIIIAQCELAVAQTPTLTAAYTDIDQHLTGEPSSVPELLVSWSEIEAAKTELTIWARRFKTELLAYVDCTRQGDVSSSVTLFADMTLIHYFSTLVALSNHSISVLKKHQVHFEDYVSRLNHLNVRLRSDIKEIADRIKRLNDRGLAHYLPISAPACTALPFVLEALDFRLSSSAQRPIHQKQLDNYTKIMQIFRAQHDHTECVTKAVENISQVVELEMGNMLTAPNTSRAAGITSYGMTTTLSRPSSWSDILANNPLVYLRLSSFLDLALSRGKMPHVGDFSSWKHGTTVALQAQVRSLSLYSMSPSIPQDMLLHHSQSRLVEIDEEEGSGMEEQWTAFDQTTSFEYPVSWSFADMDTVGLWFDLN